MHETASAAGLESIQEQTVMTFDRARFLAAVVGVILGVMGTEPFLHSQASDEHRQGASHGPALLHTCLITSNVKRLVEFYEPVLNLKAKWSGDDYAEFATGVGVLAIFSAEAQEKYIPGSADAAKNRSSILEFRVENVDDEYRRLETLVKVWVKPPTTQPWGTRSIYFRDPDGNLVDFYTPAKAR
jgi:catechol 2,3-dioxygenase-like lactoylglutathione lyase family enzyme